MLRRNILAAALLFCCGVVPSDAFVRGGSAPSSGTNPSGSTTFATIPTGGGGYVTHLQIVGSVMVVGTNSALAYLYNTGTGNWDTLLTVPTIPSTVFGVGATGVGDIRIAPSVPTTFYTKFSQHVLVSLNSGVSWTDTAIPHDSTNPNGANSGTSGPLLDIDPQNPDIVLNSSPGAGGTDGLYYTLNGTHAGGATWNLIPGVPQSTDAIVISYDPTSSVVGGVKQGIFACSAGTGCYHTTTGPAGTWNSIVSGGPTNVVQSVVNPLGELWAYGGGIWRWRSGTWTQVLTDFTTCGNNACGSIAFDPNNCSSTANCRVFVTNYDGELMVSLDDGATFNRTPTPHTVVATDIPWLPTADQSDMSAAGHMQMDGSGKLWLGAGTGVFTTTPPTSNVSTSPVAWTSHTQTQETLVPSVVLAPPGGGVPNTFVWDQGAFYNSSTTAYPTIKRLYQGLGIIGGWSADYVYSSPATMVVAAAANSGTMAGKTIDYSSITTDGGQTWTPFGPQSASAVTFNTGSRTWGPENSLKNLTVQVGDTITAIDNTSALTKPNMMLGTITAYNSSTGTLTVNVTAVPVVCPACGSSISAWIIHTIPSDIFNNHPGGCIAAISPTKFVWIPGDGTTTVWYTADGALSWNAVSGLPTDGWHGFQFNKKGGQCAASRVASTFYLYNTGASAPGFYSCAFSTSTPSCSKVFTGTITPDDGFPIMKTNPNGDIYMSFGGSFAFKKSSNGGVSWSNIVDGSNAFTNISSFGFGAAFPGQSNSAIYVSGNDGTSFGLFRSIDNGVTWTLLAQWPNGSAAILRDIDGDKATYGTVYFGPDGQGWAYGHL